MDIRRPIQLQIGTYLIDLESVALEEAGIGRDDVTKLHVDYVSGHEDCRLHLTPPAVSEDLHHHHTQQINKEIDFIEDGCDPAGP
jgi:hypothetical protein